MHECLVFIDCFDRFVHRLRTRRQGGDFGVVFGFALRRFGLERFVRGFDAGAQTSEQFVQSGCELFVSLLFVVNDSEGTVCADSPSHGGRIELRGRTWDDGDAEDDPLTWCHRR